MYFCYFFFFFFKQKTAYEMAQCDWSSDVCSSDLHGLRSRRPQPGWQAQRGRICACHDAREAPGVPLMVRTDHGAPPARRHENCTSELASPSRKEIFMKLGKFAVLAAST